MITIGLKMAWEPKNCYQGVSRPWIIWSQKKISKKSLQCCSSPPSWTSWSWRPSCSSCKSWRGQIHPKFLISHRFRAHIEIQKWKAKYFYFLLIIYLKILFEIWNLWTNLRARSGHPSTVSAIFTWPWQVSLNCLGIPYIHRIHIYYWFKFEDLTPTGSDSRERQKV